MVLEVYKAEGDWDFSCAKEKSPFCLWKGWTIAQQLFFFGR
jgi:hypothetical protein